MKEYKDFKAKISNDDRTKNYKYFRELDVPGWEIVRDEMLKFTTKTRPEISLGMGKPLWRRCWPEPYKGLRNACPSLWDVFEPLFGEIRSVGFFVMLSRDCSIHTDNYDAVGDGLPEATKRINIPIQNCAKTHTRWFIAHGIPDIAAYDGPNLTAPVARPVDLKKMANPESIKSVIGKMQYEHLMGEKVDVSGKSHIVEYANLKSKDGKKVFVPDGTHYNTFHEDEVTEVSRVELLKPTIIRVNEPHQVVIDKGWNFPRVAATVGFIDEDRLTI
jgi:hypothetical protein